MLMIHCSNCRHCVVKVDVFGNDEKGFKWARYAVCEKGAAVNSRGVNKSMRLLSNVREMTMDKCEFYEPMGEGTFGTKRYKPNISFDNLDWYYKHNDLKNIAHVPRV